MIFNVKYTSAFKSKAFEHYNYSNSNIKIYKPIHKHIVFK